MVSIAMQKTNDREIAKEIVQTVFVSFYNYRDSLQEIGSLRAYLYTMVKNKILDHFRSRQVQEQFKLQVSHSPAHINTNDVDTYIDTRELEKKLHEEVLRLPPQCRTVFRLRREEELSNREIAIRMNISENTVEQHMRKALRSLRNALHVAHRSFFSFLIF